MSMSFLEYAAAMYGCYEAMPEDQRVALHAWEAKYVDGSGTYSTSDWPGWERYIGKFQLPEPKEPNTFGYVYLIQSGTGHCKIGSSQSVSNRMRQLQCANPGPLILLHYFASPNAMRDERELHKEFAQKRVMNEWFSLTEADIASISSRGPHDG
ncbi:MAG: GIY-YIG nuclease family protein [Pseudomonadota bacterium]